MNCSTNNLSTGRTVNDVVFLRMLPRQHAQPTSLASPEFDIFPIYQWQRQHAYLFWPIYQSFHDFHLTSARMLPRQHAHYFFLAYLAVFLWFWASQAGSFKNLRMLPKTTTLTVLPVLAIEIGPTILKAMNNNNKWLFYHYFWPYFCQLYNHISQN